MTSLQSVFRDTHYAQWTGLTILGVLLVLLRLPAYFEPLERDITHYAFIAHELLQGQMLYADIWDHKPPAIYAAYALAELIVGYGVQQVFLLNIVTALIVMIGIYYVTKSLSESVFGGLAAAAVWVLIGASIPLQANQPNGEVFMNACLVWAMVLLLRFQGKNFAVMLMIAGLFALASFYKHITVVATLFLAIAWLIYPSTYYRRRHALGHIFTWLVVGAAAWGALFVYFFLTGHFTAFYESVFEFNLSYAGSQQGVDTYQPAGVTSNLNTLLKPKYLFPPAL